MQLGENIAKNAALRENVFMMAICVELRIPLFLVGKPGSSKSLAKSIISESMRGKDSRNDLLKKFKEVHCIYLIVCNITILHDVHRLASSPISAVSSPLLTVSLRSSAMPAISKRSKTDPHMLLWWCWMRLA